MKEIEFKAIPGGVEAEIGPVTATCEALVMISRALTELNTTEGLFQHEYTISFREPTTAELDELMTERLRQGRQQQGIFASDADIIKQLRVQARMVIIKSLYRR